MRDLRKKQGNEESEEVFERAKSSLELLCEGAAEGDPKKTAAGLLWASPMQRKNGFTVLSLACGAALPQHRQDDHNKWGVRAVLIPWFLEEEGADRMECVKMLLSAGASPACRDQQMAATPLHWSAKSGFARVARMLVDGGAELEAKDRKGRTPLIWACAEAAGVAPAGMMPAREDGAKWGMGALKAVRELLWLGADPTVVDEEGMSALHHAACSPEAIECLLSNGAEIDVRDRQGRTALSLACKADRLDAAEALLSAGANPGAVDARGRQPWRHGSGRASAWTKVMGQAREIELACVAVPERSTPRKGL